MKSLLKNITHIALIGGIIISLGVATTYGQGVWKDATGTTGDANAVPVPIHKNNSQVKDGSLTVNGFTSYSNVYIEQNAFFKGMIRGGDIGTPQDDPNTAAIEPLEETFIYFGQPNIQDGITLLIKGAADAYEALLSSDIIAPTDETRKLCANNDGVIGFCLDEIPPKIDYCDNIKGDQTFIPQGATYQSNNTCTYPLASATLEMEVFCNADAPTGLLNLSGGGIDLSFLGSDSALQGGYWDMKLKLSKAPQFKQNLYLRVCYSHPGANTKFLGYSTVYDKYQSCEGQPTVYSQIGGTKQNVYQILSIPKNADPLSQLFDATIPPMIIPVPAGATEVSIPNMYCSRAGKGNKLKFWSVSGVDYRFEKTNPGDTTTYGSLQGLGATIKLLP